MSPGIYFKKLSTTDRGRDSSKNCKGKEELPVEVQTMHERYLTNFN
jgi:hypothetical protein